MPALSVAFSSFCNLFFPLTLLFFLSLTFLWISLISSPTTTHATPSGMFFPCFQFWKSLKFWNSWNEICPKKQKKKLIGTGASSAWFITPFLGKQIGLSFYYYFENFNLLKLWIFDFSWRFWVVFLTSFQMMLSECYYPLRYKTSVFVRVDLKFLFLFLFIFVFGLLVW